MKLLAIGDVCSPCGVRALLHTLPMLKKEFNADAVIVNGENSALGNGITPQSAMDIFAAGADVITGGNHSLRRAEILPLLDSNPFLLRPHNMESESGSGYCFLDMGRTNLAVLNISGQIYLDRVNASNPFLCADALIERAISDGAKHIFVDFHAEATSEKRAMGYYLDGKVTAIFGTHTHVQTSDAQILPHGTGYITDLGMTGPKESVLGVKTEIIINRLRDGDQSKFEFAEGQCIISGCLFETEPLSPLCANATSFTRVINP